MDKDLSGKNVLISGGTSGIGLATAKLLSQAGANVFIYGRNQKKLDNAILSINKSGGKAYGQIADQAKKEDMEKIFSTFDKELGPLDILINNASLGARSIIQTTLENIEYSIQTNLLGYMYCTRLAIDRMKLRKTGHIVFIGSMSAEVADDGASVYVTAKSAVRGLTRSLRKELNDLGIKVTLIEPGNVATGMVSETSVQKKDLINKGHMLQPQDIAEAVHYAITQPANTDILLIQLKPRNQKF